MRHRIAPNPAGGGSRWLDIERRGTAPVILAGALVLGALSSLLLTLMSSVRRRDHCRHHRGRPARHRARPRAVGPVCAADQRRARANRPGARRRHHRGPGAGHRQPGGPATGPATPAAPLRPRCCAPSYPVIGARLLAMERECQAGKYERREKDRQNPLSGASESHGFVLGGVEGLSCAGISAVPNLQGVTSRFDRYLDGVVHFELQCCGDSCSPLFSGRRFSGCSATVNPLVCARAASSRAIGGAGRPCR